MHAGTIADAALIGPADASKALHSHELQAWGAMVAAGLLWWAPTIALALGTLAADRARFALTLGLLQVLRVMGRKTAARRMCEAALSRCEVAARCRFPCVSQFGFLGSE